MEIWEKELGLVEKFTELVETFIRLQANQKTSVERIIRNYATIKFTAAECSEMDEPFKMEFKRTGRVARVEKGMLLASGEIFYEIIYRRNGYNISASSTDINEAKRLFIKKTKSIEFENFIEMEGDTNDG